ncbi:hypothetical protein Tsp_06411 [Trichinella spiralis]|uniref:hypothetical protein n=1 Tax=Trichinella spiralis TaxID=6334 RepID=UPI0001EFC2C3|nr:hypothetical protein Tsp_06411 [Trichinella spiralis]
MGEVEDEDDDDDDSDWKAITTTFKFQSRQQCSKENELQSTTKSFGLSIIALRRMCSFLSYNSTFAKIILIFEEEVEVSIKYANLLLFFPLAVIAVGFAVIVIIIIIVVDAAAAAAASSAGTQSKQRLQCALDRWMKLTNVHFSIAPLEHLLAGRKQQQQEEQLKSFSLRQFSIGES